MENVKPIMGVLAAALGASFLVERIIEFLKNILNFFIGSKDKRLIPDAQAANLEFAELKDSAENDQRDEEWQEQNPENTVLMESATDPDNGWLVKTLSLQLLGFALGILVARFMNLRIFAALAAKGIEAWGDFVLTGLLIGGGSGPIHVLIRFITQRTVTFKEGEERAVTKGSAAVAEEKERKNESPQPLPAASLEQEIREELNIPYDGGIDREKLDDIRRRKADPSVVVYHHTAMHSGSTFADVVRVIKDHMDERGRHWVTGYHCVVTADGAIHPFCRWDRYGNHAKGHNMESLGIAFNGNFESNPAVPHANVGGRYGNMRPTEAQLRAGARVVALWMHLYKIKPGPAGKVMAHGEVALRLDNDTTQRTACPGSDFPHEEFKGWVDFYYTRWKEKKSAMDLINAFALKPYLFVKNRT